MSIDAQAVLDQTAPKEIQPATVNTSGGSTDANSAPPPQEDNKLSGKFELLLRREREAVEAERRARDREKSIEERERRVQEFESAKGDSKKAMELLGLNYDELTQSVLNDGAIPPEVQIRKLDEKLEQFKSEQQKAEEARLLQDKEAREQNEIKVVGDFKSSISKYIKDNQTRYELTQFEDQSELVFSVIDEHYKRTLDPDSGIGKVMSIEEAADKVELFLEQKEMKRKELSKVKTLWNMLPKSVQGQAQKQANAQSSQAGLGKTLTNNLSASPAQARKAPLSDEERVQRAIAYARGLRPDLR